MLPRELHPNYSRILQALQKSSRPLSSYDLELQCFLDVRNVRTYLKLMHSQGKIHIRNWRRDAPRGPWVPLYCYGKGVDKVKPDRRTNAEVQRQRRQQEEVKAKERAYKSSKRVVKRIQPNPSIVNIMLGIKHAS